MPIKPRFIIPGVPVHIVQRGRSREPVFYDEADYRVYLGRLKEAAEKYQCQIHAYVLMTNHIHLLATPLKLLYELKGETFADKESWQKLLDRLSITNPRYQRFATEGALLGSALRHCLHADLVILSDDAGQFNLL